MRSGVILKLTLGFFFLGFFFFVGADISWTSDSEILLDSSSDDSVFLGRYVLSLLASSESDSVGIGVSGCP
jgi:hypothetical protein